MLLDIGATKTIIRPDIVTTPTMIKPTKWRLRTATGEPAKVHGEVKVQVTLGSTNFKHQMLVADIKEEVIIGMDIMNSRGFQLDFKRGTLTVNNEEVVLHGKSDEVVSLLLGEDTSIPERSEMILLACLDDNARIGDTMVFEPKIHDNEVGRGVLVGKTLLQIKETVPVRVMNVNHYSVVLKKGTVLGHCSAVSSIVRRTLSDARSNP
jgi:predicted aspartyl protease